MKQDEPHIQVKSEEEVDKLLLDTKIVKDDGYQKQQGTCGLVGETIGILTD